MIFLIITGVVVIIILGALSPQIIEESRIMSQAREDYLQCRGTNHARLLQAAINRHQEAVNELEVARKNLDYKIQQLDKEINEQLQRALATHLVKSQFTGIPGIGSKLRDRIISTCFDGTLDSLNRSQLVRGVGPEKAAAIRAWVYQMKRSMPKLLKSDFPGKQDILEKQRERRHRLMEKRSGLNEEIIARKRVIDRARDGLASFAGVTVSDFRKALRGDAEASQRIAKYSLGAFAEWESMPEWFAAIISEPGEQRDAP